MTDPFDDVRRVPVDGFDSPELDWPPPSRADGLAPPRDGETVPEPSWPIPLMGKTVTGPFFEQTDDGAPLVELCTVTRSIEGGRSVDRAETIDLITHDTRWSDLRADGELESGRYRLRVRSATGQILASHDLTIGRPASRGRQGKGRTRPTAAQAETQAADRGRLEAERGQLTAEVARLRAELDDTRRRLDDATRGAAQQVHDVRTRLMGEMDDARELTRKRHNEELTAQADRFGRQLADLREDLREAREAQRRAEGEARKAERAQWEAEKKALLASAAGGGGGTGIEQIRQLMVMKGEIDELLGGVGAGGGKAPLVSMDDRVNSTLNSLSNVIGNLGKIGAVAGLG